jgi:hypothetical protein
MSPSKVARRGFSLIEVVLVIGGVAMLLGMSTGLLHLMLRLDRVGRSHYAETATIGRLSRQFRQDVRAAVGTKASDPDEGPLAKLELVMSEGHVVSYESRERGLTRTERQGESVRRREGYALPSCAGPRFLVRKDDDRVWVSLRLPRVAEPRPESLRHVLNVDALMGRDHRWSKPEETSP